MHAYEVHFSFNEVDENKPLKLSEGNLLPFDAQLIHKS